MDMKKKMIKPEIRIIRFETEDIMTDSVVGVDPGTTADVNLVQERHHSSIWD